MQVRVPGRDGRDAQAGQRLGAGACRPSYVPGGEGQARGWPSTRAANLGRTSHRLRSGTTRQPPYPARTHFELSYHRCDSASELSISFCTACMKASRSKPPLTSDSTMPSIVRLAIDTPHSLHSAETSVTAVIDGKDSDNWVGVTIGFRRVGIVVLVVDTSRAAHFIVDCP